MTTHSARGALCAALVLLAGAASPLAAQQPSTRTATDSAARDSVTRAARTLERVTVTALRGGNRAPVAQTTLTPHDIPARDFGIEVPVAVQHAPALTSYDETGTYWGYSYLRLRGIDQSRINITLDGIPLNDPEDQVLYFADFPDLASSLSSVEVQRGVGTSSNGTASYAGSMSLETTPLATAHPGAAAEVTAGSFGAKRAMFSYATGLTPSRWAANVRLSALQENGYREHSGVLGRSALASVGYFGDRNIVKLTATAGMLRDTLAYVGVPASVLDTNRRVNPLRPDELDHFGEQLVALAYTRLVNENTSWSTTVYRTSAAGAYDVCVWQCDMPRPNADLQSYHLDFAWYGVTSAWTRTGEHSRVDVGVNANTYARNHYAYDYSDLSTQLYFNTGHKQDASAFAKGSYALGRTTLFGDVQGRWAEFRYTPDRNADIGGSSITWTFLNPKVGATVQLTKALAAFASYGVNGREPARGDMFAGFDNLDTSNANFVGPFSRVRPERVGDLETGLDWRGSSLRLAGNVFAMQFHNEILPIGQLTYWGSPLRKNVDASYRRGVELEGEWRPVARFALGGNAAFTWARVHSYVDETGNAPVTYDDVPPLLTPRTILNQHVEVGATRAITLRLDGRYTSRSYLTNTGDASTVLPSAYTMDGELEWTLGRWGVLARGGNLTNSKRYGSGTASGGEAQYYILPPRNLLVTLRAAF